MGGEMLGEAAVLRQDGRSYLQDGLGPFESELRMIERYMSHSMSPCVIGS